MEPEVLEVGSFLSLSARCRAPSNLISADLRAQSTRQAVLKHNPVFLNVACLHAVTACTGAKYDVVVHAGQVSPRNL